MRWTKKDEISKPQKIMPMEWGPLVPQEYGRYTVRFLYLLLIVLLLIALSGCSKAVSISPMPPPPVNLETPCRELPNVPSPLIDPERVLWENELLIRYAECSVKHRLTVEAWLEAVKQK